MHPEPDTIGNTSNYKEITIHKASWQQNLHYSFCEANLLGFSFLPLPFWLHFWLFRMCFGANNGSSLPSPVNLLHMSAVFEVTFFNLWVDLTLTKRKVYLLNRQGEQTPSNLPLAVLHTFATASQSRAKQPSSSPELWAGELPATLSRSTNRDYITALAVHSSVWKWASLDLVQKVHVISTLETNPLHSSTPVRCAFWYKDWESAFFFSSCHKTVVGKVTVNKAGTYWI